MGDLHPGADEKLPTAFLRDAEIHTFLDLGVELVSQIEGRLGIRDSGSGAGGRGTGGAGSGRVTGDSADGRGNFRHDSGRSLGIPAESSSGCFRVGESLRCKLRSDRERDAEIEEERVERGASCASRAAGAGATPNIPSV